MSRTGNTTVRTSSAKALAAWQDARQKVMQAGAEFANKRTAAAKKALKKAQADEQRLLLNYANSRLIKFAQVTDQQRRTR